MLVGKNDCLADGITSINGEPRCHEIFQNEVNGLLVVDIVEDFGTADVSWRWVRPIFRTGGLVLPNIFKLLLLLRCKFLVFNSFAQMF